MYQPHNVLLFVPCALLFWLLGAISITLHNKGKLKVGWLSGVFGFGFVGAIFLMAGIKEYDDYSLRKELRNIPPNSMSHFSLSEGESRQGIDSSLDVSKLMSQIQTVKHCFAHHSHQTETFEITFEYRSQCYQYSVGLDSRRPGEYWVNALGREYDIGRFHSDDLGQVVQSLLADKPQAIK